MSVLDPIKAQRQATAQESAAQLEAGTVPEGQVSNAVGRSDQNFSKEAALNQLSAESSVTAPPKGESKGPV